MIILYYSIFLMIFLLISGLTAQSAEAVSYTHLDVYKRQDGEAVVLTQEQQKLFAAWNFLSAKQRRLMLEFVDTFQEEIGKAAKNEL